jgi:hypothetical protein
MILTAPRRRRTPAVSDLPSRRTALNPPLRDHLSQDSDLVDRTPSTPDLTTIKEALDLVYTDRDGSKCRKDAAGHTTGRVQLRNNLHVLHAPGIERSITIVEETDVSAQGPTQKNR